MAARWSWTKYGRVGPGRRNGMVRRMSTCVAALGLALLALPVSASATPTLGFKMKAVPIPGFPHTGDILGAGADAVLEYAIEGTEYFGSPPPIIGANFYVPTGVVLNAGTFPSCPEATILSDGPEACPKGSSLGPIGKATGDVTFGGERVGESAELVPFFGPGGSLEYFGDGRSPVSVEVVVKGHFRHLGGVGGYELEEEEEVPLIATVPGAPYVSVTAITGKFGAAMRSHGRPIYFLRLPKTCPKGGLPLKTEAIFAGNGEPSKPETVDAFYTVPCPRR
jgi:hypothetical protein